MANKDNIVLLSKYQMRVLYYKCTEGLTHAEIAELLDRDVNTIQYHMTKIYTILEIKIPGRSKESMESELKNEICPIIRAMFDSIDKIKNWAPVIKEPKLPYKPPPSLEKILNSSESQSVNPEILGPPPPGRRRINWRLIIVLIVVFVAISLLIIILWKSYLSKIGYSPEPTVIPTQPIPDQLVPPPNPAEVPTEIPTLTPTQTHMPTASPSPTFTPFEIITTIDPIDGMVLIRIPVGEFEMGSYREGDSQAFDKELIQHRVYLDTYWIDQTEVTNAKYTMCVASGECTQPANNFSVTRNRYYDDSQYADYPVIFVNWSQAAAYCAWVGRRLPTEAEWEKAARGPESRIYPWGDNFDGTLANYCDLNCDRPWKDNRFDDGYTDTSPVGSYADGASFYGVQGMAGNVHEWVADWYGPYTQDYQTNPTGPESGLDKIMRGGSWGDDFTHIRSDVRSPINPDNWLDFIGFRCARSPD